MRAKISEIYAKALVTGASRGLGRAFADMLLDEGVEVWGTSRDITKLPKRDGFHPIELDLNNNESLTKLIDMISKEDLEINLLINNAGAGAFAQFEDFPLDEIDKQSAVLFTAPVKLCRNLYPRMKLRGRGAIINVSSVAADYPIPFMPMYNAGKAALSNFTRTLEIDAIGTQIKVVDFQPGDYNTDFNRSMYQTKDVLSSRERRVWEMLEAHLESGPAVEHAAAILRKTLLSKRSGLIRTGTLFQAKIAPMLARFAPWSTIRRVIERYFGL